MKKLTLILSLVLLCINAQAQDRSKIVGKWKLDKDMTFELNPEMKKSYEEGSEREKVLMDQFFQGYQTEFEENGDFFTFSIAQTAMGKWKLNDGTIELKTNDKTQSLNISSLESNTMILTDKYNMKFGFKRKE